MATVSGIIYLLCVRCSRRAIYMQGGRYLCGEHVKRDEPFTTNKRAV